MDQDQFSNDAALPTEIPSESTEAPVQDAPQTPPSTGALYDVKADGQSLKVPLDELIRGYQRHSQWTRKNQEHTEFRRQAEERINALQGMLQQTAQLMRDKQAVREYLAELEGTQADPGQASPQSSQELATAAQLKQAMEELARRNDMTVQQLRQSLEVEKQANVYRTQIDGFVGTLLQKHPELKAVPNAERMLRQAAIDARVNSIEDTFSVMADEARQMSTHIKAFVDYQHKQAAKPVQPIPPASGAPPKPPQPESFKSVMDPRLREQAIKDLMELSAGSL